MPTSVTNVYTSNAWQGPSAPPTNGVANWSTASYWTNGSTPGSTTDVLIASASSSPTISTAVGTINSLSLASNSYLYLSSGGSLTATNLLYNTSASGSNYSSFGTLSLTGGALTVTNAVTVGSSTSNSSGYASINLNGGTITAPSLGTATAANGYYSSNSLSIYGSGGTINASLIGNVQVSQYVYGGSTGASGIVVNGNLANDTGSFNIGGGTLELNSGASFSTGISFNSSSGNAPAVLKLDNQSLASSVYKGTITGFSLGNQIDLANVTVSSSQISYNATSSTLTIAESNGVTLSYGLTGSFAGLVFKAVTDGNNGTLISLGTSGNTNAWQGPSAPPTNGVANWSTASYWTNGSTPGSTTDVLIASASSSPTISTAVGTINSLSLASNSYLYLSSGGSLTATNLLYNTSASGSNYSSFGTLSLTGGALTVTNAVTVGSSTSNSSGYASINLNGGTITAPSLGTATAANGYYSSNSLSIYGSGGTINASLIGNVQVSQYVYGGSTGASGIVVNGNLANDTGSFNIGGGTLELNSGASFSTGISFNSSSGNAPAVLKLDNQSLASSVYKGTITGFSLGNQIDLANVTVSSSQISYNATSSTLTIAESNGVTLSYGLTGSFAGLVFKAVTDGNNGTLISLGTSGNTNAWQGPSAPPTNGVANWSTASYWTNGSTPGSTTDVLIASASSSPTISTAVGTINSLSLASNSYLYLSSGGSLTATNLLYNTSASGSNYSSFGTLSLTGGALTVTNAVTVGSSTSNSSGYASINLNGGTITAPSLGTATAANGYYSSNSLSIYGSGGTINASLIGNVQVSQYVYGGSTGASGIVVNGNLANDTGSFNIGGGTLELNSGASFSTGISFNSSSGNAPAVLKLDNQSLASSVYKGTITGFSLGNQIDLANVTVSLNSSTSPLVYNASSSTLSVAESNGASVSYKISGTYTGLYFNASSDGNGGTLISLGTSPTLGSSGTSGPSVSISNPGGAVQSSAQTITGIGLAGSIIRLYDNNQSLGLAITVSNTGTWSSSVTLSSGSNNIYATDTDSNGNVGTSSSVTFTYTSPLPVVTISSAGGTASALNQSISGYGVAGTTINIFDNNVLASSGSITVGSNGLWTSTVRLSIGANNVYATDTDSNGNVGTSNTVSYTLNSSNLKINSANNFTTLISSGWQKVDSDIISKQSLFNITGNPTQLKFIDVTGNSLTQLFEQGVSSSSSGYSLVNVSDILAGKVYVRGLGVGNDTFSVQAFDGITWSNVVAFTAIVKASDVPLVIKSNNVKATVENNSTNGGTFLSSLISFTNPTSNSQQAPTKLQIYDSYTNSDGGYFSYIDLNGVYQKIASGVVVQLDNPTEISSLEYHASTTTSSTGSLINTETLNVNVYDGYAWSGWYSWSQESGSSTHQAPIVTHMQNRTAYIPSGWQNIYSSIITDGSLSTYDAAGSAITLYRIMDTSTSNAHLQFFKAGTNSGIVSAGNYLYFTAQDLSIGNIYIQGVSAGTDILSIQAYDGQDWSLSTQFTIAVRATDSPFVISSKNISVYNSAALSSMVSISNPSNDSIQQLQFYDTGSNGDGGYFTYLDGSNNLQRATAGQIVTLTSTNEVASLKYVASSTNNASELLYIKAFDGFTWSDWFSWNQISTTTAPVLPAPTPIRQASTPFILKTQAGVVNWKITLNMVVAGINSTAVYTIHQDGGVANGSTIGFSPSFNSHLSPGDSFTVVAQGYDTNGNLVVSNGQLAISTDYFGKNINGTGYSSSISLKLISIDQNGNISGLPANYSSTDANYYLLSSSDSTGISAAALANALSNNSSLKNYVNAGQLSIGDLKNDVNPVGIKAVEPIISINGTNLMALPGSGDITNGALLAIKSPSATTVNIWTSTNGQTSSLQQTVYLSANQAYEIWGYLFNPSDSSSQVMTTNVFFTDVNGNPVNGLQASTISASGGGISDTSWQYVDSYFSSTNSLTIYRGTVSQILTASHSASSGSMYFISDSIENIQLSSNEPALYNLLLSGQLIGAYITDGFDAISNSSSQSYTPVMISNGINNAYLSIIGRYASQSGEMAHAVLAIKTGTGSLNGQASGGNLSTPVVVYINGLSSNVIGNSATITGMQTNDLKGLVLSNVLFTNLTNNAIYSITASSGASFGIVPLGGGLPSSYASSINMWVGTVAQLPTSLSDVVTNTLYVVNDSIENIVSLDSYGSLKTDVLSQLASAGLFAYNVTNKSIGWASLYQLQQVNNLPIANISNLKITDSAYAIENHLTDLGAGQTIAIKDTIGRLLGLGLAQYSYDLSNGISTTGAFVNSSSLATALISNSVIWSDNLVTVLNPVNLSKMSEAYNGQGHLQAVQIHDTVADWGNLIKATQVQSIVSFANSNANGQLIVDVRDTVANINSALTSAGVGAFENKLSSLFSGVTSSNLAFRIEIQDSVSNLEAAADSGIISTLSRITKGFWNSINPSANANNQGLNLRVEDSLAHINAFLINSSYANLVANVNAFIVTDSGANLATAFAQSSWATAFQFANNIVVKDSYLNVLNNESQLFNANQTGHEVTKVFFTDVTGANSSNPIVISANYSYSGQVPQFDFSKAIGLQGVLKVSESVISSSIISLNQQAGNPLWTYADTGVALTVSDSNNHQVVIDVLSAMPGSQISNPDPNNNLISDVILPQVTLPQSILAPTANQIASPGFILIKGNSSVNYWLASFNLYSSNGTLQGSATIKIIQDASGGDVNFDPNLDTAFNGFSPAIGSYMSVSAVGYSNSGVAVSAGQVAFNGASPNYVNTAYLGFASVDASGNVTNILGYSSSITESIWGTNGVSGQSTFSLQALTKALESNSTLAQYAVNGQLLLGGLQGVVQLNNISSPSSSISVDGMTLFTINGLNNSDPVAISSPINTTLVQHISITSGNNNQTNTSYQSLLANSPMDLWHWSWGIDGFSGLTTTTIYFTDQNNASISGLQIANMASASGGLFTANNWINVGSGSNTPITIYSGSISQLQAYFSNTQANTFFYIKDTISNIQADGVQLYALTNAGKILGAEPLDGFEGIAGMSSGFLSSTAVSDSNGNISYIKTLQGDVGSELSHSVLAIQSSSGTAAATIYIDGKFEGTVSNLSGGTLLSNGSLVNGLTLSSSFLAGLSTGYHSISAVDAVSRTPLSIGVVPAGGGLPPSSTYSAALNLWIGPVANLPTSDADVQANTLYIINDTASNLIALDGYSTAININSVLALATSGYLAYNIIGQNGASPSLTWTQLHSLQQTSNNIPIANISNIVIADSAMGVDHHYYDMGAGQSLSITDNTGKLLSADFALAAQFYSNNQSTAGANYLVGWGSSASNQLQAAFNNHAVHWSTAISEIIGSSPLATQEMGNVYYGSNSALGSVLIRDAVSAFSSITSSSQVSGISTFINSNAHGNVLLDITDTAANLYSALVATNPAGLENNMANAFGGVQNISTRIEVQDTVANIEAAYNAGKILALQTVANNLFTNTSYGAAINDGLYLRVTDTVANISAFINNSNYSQLSSNTLTYNVLDTASNIAQDMQQGHWDTATINASNIFVQDTYANIITNETTLFTNSNSVATKLIFTSLATATSNNPIVISQNYSTNGQLPTFDFSNVMTGTISVSETFLKSTEISNYLPSGTSNYGQGGISLVVTDTAGNQANIVEILQNPLGSTYAPDPLNTAMLSVLGNNKEIFNLTPGNVSTNPNSGSQNSTISSTNFESILNWNTGDKINFLNSANSTTPLSMSVIGPALAQSTSTTGTLSLALSGNNQGLVTFSSNSTDTLQQQIQDIETLISNGSPSSPTMPHTAYWQNGNDTYALVTYGHTNSTIGNQDDLVKLVGVSTTHVQLSGGSLVAV